jgi:hypothetical protein
VLELEELSLLGVAIDEALQFFFFFRALGSDSLPGCFLHWDFLFSETGTGGVESALAGLWLFSTDGSASSLESVEDELVFVAVAAGVSVEVVVGVESAIVGISFLWEEGEEDGRKGELVMAENRGREAEMGRRRGEEKKYQEGQGRRRQASDCLVVRLTSRTGKPIG